MQSLYELSTEWQTVYDMLLDPEIPEDAIFDTIEMIEIAMDDKADVYAKIIRSMDGTTGAIDAEIKRLQERKASIANRKERLKQGLEHMMRLTGRTKFKTALFSFNIQKNGGVQPLVMNQDVPVPDEWLAPGLPDTGKIRAFLQSGGTLPFATLGERGESLRIR